VSAPARIRRARIDEAPLLTELTTRSKAHWQYDAAFLADARQDLTFEPEKFLPDFLVYVFELNGEMLGFCSLLPHDDARIELHDLFVEPRHIGKGYGKQLWDYAVNLARESGFQTLVLTSDPNAEPFYARQGAVRIGLKPSSVRPDRVLPVMEYRISD